MAKPWPPPGRIPCMVLGCRRTASQEKLPGCTRIICGKCWKLAPKHFRRRVRCIERIGRKLGIDWDTVGWEDTASASPGRRALLLHSQAFDRLAAAATEVKVGIRAQGPQTATRRRRKPPRAP